MMGLKQPRRKRQKGAGAGASRGKGSTHTHSEPHRNKTSAPAHKRAVRTKTPETAPRVQTPALHTEATATPASPSTPATTTLFTQRAALSKRVSLRSCVLLLLCVFFWFFFRVCHFVLYERASACLWSGIACECAPFAFSHCLRCVLSCGAAVRAVLVWLWGFAAAEVAELCTALL